MDKLIYTKCLIYKVDENAELYKDLKINVEEEEKWVDFAFRISNVIGFRGYDCEEKQICVYIGNDSFVLPYSFDEFKNIMEA